jgi:hypothetical protein
MSASGENRRTMSAFMAALKGQFVRAGIRKLSQRARNFVSPKLLAAKLRIAPDSKNSRIGLAGPPLFCHTEFRTALLS